MPPLDLVPLVGHEIERQQVVELGGGTEMSGTDWFCKVAVSVAGAAGVPARGRVPGRTGVWVGARKLAAVGVRVSGGVATHARVPLVQGSRLGRPAETHLRMRLCTSRVTRKLLLTTLRTKRF